MKRHGLILASAGWAAYLASWIPLTSHGVDPFWSKWRINDGYMALGFAFDGIGRTIPLAISFVGNFVILYTPIAYVAMMRGCRQLWVAYCLLALTPANVAAPFLWFRFQTVRFGAWPWLLGVSFPLVAAGLLTSAASSHERFASK